VRRADESVVETSLVVGRFVVVGKREDKKVREKK